MRNYRNVGASIARPPRFVVFESQLEASGGEISRLEAFIASMPERYGQEFGGVMARQHAQIVLERGRQPIHAGRFLGVGTPGPGICIVALDRPGVLASVSTVLTVEGFDIVRADVFTRKAPSFGREVVAFFWVRRLPSDHLVRLHEPELSSLIHSLRHWLENGDPRSLVDTLPGTASPRSGETSMRFRSVRGIPRVTLELQADDRPGLLALVTATLAAERVQVVACRIRTRGVRVYDYFDLVDVDGSSLRAERLHGVELAILSAIGASRSEH